MKLIWNSLKSLDLANSEILKLLDTEKLKRMQEIFESY